MITTQSLGGLWQWQAVGERELHTGEVPGSVLGDMLREKLIDDPYWRKNEYKTRELMANDYRYLRRFSVDKTALEAESATLLCEGLDTIAEISINGRLAAKTDDMHRLYRIPVKELLREGENEIEIIFRSAIAFAREEDEKNDIHYASTGCIHGNAALRKAHSSFGWDWGPQLPDAGIFREIALEFSGGPRLLDWRVRQRHLEDGSVTLGVTAQAGGGEGKALSLRAELTAPDGESIAAECEYSEAAALELRVQKPRLWWPQGLGEQPLYTLSVSLLCDDIMLERKNEKIGLRTILLSTAPDEYGSEFAFVVNGVKMFAMGANLIPEDSILPNVTTERTRRLVDDCAKANFNCLRVWGGGYYPADAFYERCDEKGILVWQDLMFACNVYTLNERFEENIIAETRDAARRLRHHACLALWCGNNEMEWGWGDMWARIQGHHPRYKADYTKIFEHILPRTLAECDDETVYWPSSPSSGGSFDRPNDPDCGDQHYWEVWHSGKPFTEYRAHHFRFCSEYGFQSFPHSRTIADFTLPQDRNIFSEVMESHQKNGAANSKIFTYIADYFLYPKDLDSIAYISQVLQLKAIQYGVEHWRQNRGRCMGSLYWQLNDCWPVASWASIDYFGRWKALHHGARRFYAPVCLSAREREELSPFVTYFLHNDTREECARTLEVAIIDNDLNVIWKNTEQVSAPPLSAVPCVDVDFREFLSAPESKKECFAHCRLLEDGRVVSEATTLFVKPKHFHYKEPNYGLRVSERSGNFEITVWADCFCQYVELFFTELDVVPSDNFFDIVSLDGVTVTIEKSELPAGITAATLAQTLTVRSVVDSYTLPEV